MYDVDFDGPFAVVCKLVNTTHNVILLLSAYNKARARSRDRCWAMAIHNDTIAIVYR